MAEISSLPDIVLGIIFQMLTLLEVLNVAQIVCKSWQLVVKGPYCWKEIDIEEWSQQCELDIIDMMLQMLISRSRGSQQKLCVTGLPSDTSFSLIANNAKFVQRLELRRGEFTNSIMEQVGMLSKLTYLDESYCLNIGAPALEAIGKQCKLLTSLKRVMDPIYANDQLSRDDEAHAIAATMPNLKTLEIAYLNVCTNTIIEIISSCSHLELLNVRGCWQVTLEDSFVQKFAKLKLIGPIVVDPFENNDSDWDTESIDGGYLAFDFEVGNTDDDEILDGSSEDE